MLASPSPSTAAKTQFENMRRRIAVLDEMNAMERERLHQEQRQAAERRLEQDEFERAVQEHTERAMREHQEREDRDLEARASRQAAAMRKIEERKRQLDEQRQQDEERSRRLDTLRQEGRSVAAQVKWDRLEQELEQQWAQQEAEERRRLEKYASVRQQQFEEWERQLQHERQRFGNCFDFAASQYQQSRAAAQAKQSYAPGPPSYRQGAPRAPPKTRTATSVGGSSTHAACHDSNSWSPEEQAVMKELRSVIGASRDVQKAKVKELLFRWHPDKNPECVEHVTRVFQFVQKQRELVLGL